METVFVYGTLKEGFGNHRILKYSEYWADAVTVDRYNFFTLGPFPAVVKTNNDRLDLYRVDGEIYKVDDVVLKRLDALEGNGQLYQRRVRDFEVFLNGEPTVVKAWMYELLHQNITWTEMEPPHYRRDQFMIDGDIACWYRD